MEQMHRNVAVRSVGPSAVRGQPEGLLQVTHEYLQQILLCGIPKISETEYQRWLNRRTRGLLNAYSMHPKLKKRPWGVARKAINLFMRDVVYNRYLCEHFALGRVERWLEVPLDSQVAKGVRSEARESKTITVPPAWRGLKRLQYALSRRLQDCALQLAFRRGMARVHLDIYLWRKSG